MTDTTTITDTTQEVTEATQQAVKQVNQITQYLQDSIPGLITFGLEVLAALVAFFIGRLVIKWIRKIVRKRSIWHLLMSLRSFSRRSWSS